MRQEYAIERYGFTPADCAVILQAFNGEMPLPRGAELSSYRSHLILSVQDMHGDAGDGEDTFGMIDDAISEGNVAGDAYENMAEMDEARQHYKARLEKLAKLTEPEAREVYGFAMGFWDAKRGDQMGR